MIAMNPELIIAGTGANGLMRRSGELQQSLQAKKIEFAALSTDKAVVVYNEQVKNKRIGGCFHLTC